MVQLEVKSTVPSFDQFFDLINIVNVAVFYVKTLSSKSLKQLLNLSGPADLYSNRLLFILQKNI